MTKSATRKAVNIAVIGCGQWGPNFIRNLVSIPAARVSWVCDTSRERLVSMKQLYPALRCTRDYRSFLADRETDAVVVATPTASHYRIAKECLLSNKHVLVEKPLAASVNDAEELVRLAAGRKRIIMVGHTFEYNPAVNEIKRYIRKGRLGKIYYMHSSRTNLGPLRSDVSALWDLAPHDISIFSYLLGSRPVKVAAQGARFLRKDLEDVAFVTLHYPRNIVGSIHVSWLNPRKVREVTIVGSKKMVVFDDMAGTSPVRVYDKGVVRRPCPTPYYNTFGEFQLIVREGNVTVPRIDMKEPLLLECRHFVECIVRGRKPRSGGSAGLDVVKALAAAQKSLERNGRLVEVK